MSDVYSELDDYIVKNDYILKAYLEWERKGQHLTQKEMALALGVRPDNIRAKVNDLDMFRRSIKKNGVALKVARHCMEKEVSAVACRNAVYLVTINGATSIYDLPGIPAWMPERQILNDVFRKERNNEQGN